MDVIATFHDVYSAVYYETKTNHIMLKQARHIGVAIIKVFEKEYITSTVSNNVNIENIKKKLMDIDSSSEKLRMMAPNIL